MRSRWLLGLALLALAGCSKTTPTSQPPLSELPLGTGGAPSAWKEYADRGKALIAQDDYKGAIEQLSKAIELKRASADLFVWRSEAYRGNKQPDLAIADCDKAIALEPESLRAYLIRGYSHADLRQFDRAIADLTRFIGAGRDLTFDAYSVRAQCYQIKGDFLKALADFSTALELEPKSDSAWQAWAGKGDAHFALGDFKAATEDFGQALVLQPGQFTLLLKRCEALTRRRLYKPAVDDATAALEVKDSALARNMRAWAFIGLRQYDKAKGDFTRAIALEPQNPFHYGDRGRCLASMHEYDAALQDQEKAIALNPKEASFYCDRGKIYFVKKDYPKAYADLTRAIELNLKYFEAWLERGKVDLQLKNDQAAADLGQAIKLCNEEIRLLPTNEVAHWFRGEAAMLQGHYDQAIVDFEGALKLDQEAPDIYKSLAWIEAACPVKRLRDGKKAVEHATRACELTAWKDAEYLDVLAAAYAEAGQFDKAVEQAKATLAHAWPEFRAEAQARLELYRAGKPYRLPK